MPSRFASGAYRSSVSRANGSAPALLAERVEAQGLQSRREPQQHDAQVIRHRQQHPPQRLGLVFAGLRACALLARPRQFGEPHQLPQIRQPAARPSDRSAQRSHSSGSRSTSWTPNSCAATSRSGSGRSVATMAAMPSACAANDSPVRSALPSYSGRTSARVSLGVERRVRRLPSTSGARCRSDQPSCRNYPAATRSIVAAQSAHAEKPLRTRAEDPVTRAGCAMGSDADRRCRFSRA